MAPEPELQPSSSIGWGPGDRAEVALRILLLLILLSGAICAAVSFHQTARQQQDLVADLSAGQVRYLEYQSPGRVRWVAGSWWSWNRTTLDTAGGNTTSPGDLLLPGDPQRSGDPLLQWLQQQVSASPRSIVVTVDDGSRPRRWASRIVWQPLQWVTGFAWLGTFVMMLGRRKHRYANRWAWFWLFTVGQAGPLVYLLVEPHPLWRPLSSLPGPVPVRGGAGLLLAIFLPLLATVAAAAIAALL